MSLTATYVSIPVACNPLKISDKNRNPVCNDPDQPCVTAGTVPTSERAGIARYDAISSLNVSCTCIGDNCSGNGYDATSNPAEHTLHSGALGGAMEDNPHTWIHAALGDIVTDIEGMAGFMTSNDCAGRDPAFYLHHANIDRLWQTWANIEGNQDPVDAPSWKTQEFYFATSEGKQSSLKSPCQVIDMKELNYAYYYIDN